MDPYKSAAYLMMVRMVDVEMPILISDVMFDRVLDRRTPRISKWSVQRVRLTCKRDLRLTDPY